ncbi:MAG: hypothetical protein HY286_15050 [Planctomycetes bacterium]|nr:hypothetical protein [Planctomycetota bacterium]
MNVFDLTGPEFLVSYIFLATAILGALWWILGNLEGGGACSTITNTTCPIPYMNY